MRLDSWRQPALEQVQPLSTLQMRFPHVPIPDYQHVNIYVPRYLHVDSLKGNVSSEYMKERILTHCRGRSPSGTGPAAAFMANARTAMVLKSETCMMLMLVVDFE